MAISERYLREVHFRKEKARTPGAYPFNIPAIRQLDGFSFDAAVTILAGENGSGKSTILEALAVCMGLNAEGGSRNFNFATRASHSELHAHLRVVRGTARPRDNFFLRAESFHNVISNAEQTRVAQIYWNTMPHDMSHGEAFLWVMKERFKGKGFYILDEPEAALSPARQLGILGLIHDLVEAKSQFIIATHSPILMAYPGARIFVLNEEGIAETSYEETEHFRITRHFLNNYERLMPELMS